MRHPSVAGQRQTPHHGGGPRTVLFLHGSAGGYGADRQLYLLATGLDPSRYRPLVVLPEPGELGPRLREAGVEVHIADLAVLRRRILRGRALASTRALAARNVRELGELARVRRAAIVHSNSSIVLCGQGVADRAGAVHVQHMREIYQGVGGMLGNALWPLLRRRLARASALVCVSEAVARQFDGLERACVVYDAVPRELALPDRRSARRSFGLSDDAFVVAVVGRISDWKGHNVLLRALAEPDLADVGAIALVAGDAAPDQRHFERDLVGLENELCLDGRVRLLGFREDVETVFAAADAVAMPSTHPDALPNAALEAASARLPLVATRVGGQPEIVRDGVTGRLVPSGDAGALARALRELADDPAAARRLGEEAAADARVRFGRSRLLAEVQAKYDALVESSRPIAWLLPSKRLPIAQTVASDLRLERFDSWLSQLGYRPVVFKPSSLRSGPSLVLRALRERPRLVLANGAVCAPALACIKRLRKRRALLVADVMGLHSLEIDQASGREWTRPLVRRIWLMLEATLFRSVDLVLAVNERHAALVRRRYRPGGVHTLRDAAEAELGSIPPADRSALGIPVDAVLVGFVGSLVYSRLEPLFEAWSELAADERLSLLVVGDGPDLERYRRTAEQRGWLHRNVFFLGGVPRRDAIAALRACDISYSECWSEAGFPSKLYEYMALGMPIVTEGKPQVSEVLADGESALLFHTPAELARQIRRLADEPELRARLGAHARETLVEAHTVELRESEFASLLEDCGQATRRAQVVRPAPELVSVVMPVRNGARHVEAQLAALAAQTYGGKWELVVADNGSTDATIDIVERWRGLLPVVRVIDASARRGANYARNRGTEEASGEFLAFCDADDVVEADWLESLVEAGARADIVAGTSDYESLNPPEQRAWRRDPARTLLPVLHSFLPSANGGNCGMWTEVASDLRRDESFRYGSTDVEFAWRAQLAGYRLLAAPQAVVRKRNRTSMRSLAHQWFAYGRSQPHLYRRFRRFGMPRSSLRETLRYWRWLVSHAPDVLRSSGQRGSWLRVAALSCGRVVGSVRWRVVFLSSGAPPASHAAAGSHEPPPGPHVLEFGVRWPPETFVSRRLERLVEAGFRVTVASLGGANARTPPAGVAHVRLTDDLSDGRGRLVTLGLGANAFLRVFCRSPRQAVVVARAAATPTGAGPPAGWCATAVRLAAYARLLRVRPDIVHFEWTSTAARFLSLVDALGCPFVVSSHGGDVQITPHARSHRTVVRAFPTVLRRAAAVHCVADAVVAQTARFGLDPAKARVIRAGVDPEFFRPAEASRSEDGRFSLVSVGTLRWVKGFEYALLAVAALAREGIPVVLDILGGDPDWGEKGERERLLATSSDLGLKGRVRLHGRVFPAAVRDRLQAADVFLQSSLSEGHPTAVVEAMACGLPVVATDCGGTREAVRDGAEGFLVAPRDWRAAAAALRRLWEDAALRARMGRAGRARVEAEFTLDRQTERFAALYRDVIDRSSGR